MKMFRAGTSLEGRKPDELLKSDVKNFSVEGVNVRVCQIFTMDLESTASVENELKETMENFVATSDAETFVLMITDIFKEVSEVILAGSFKEAIARKFDKNLVGDKFFIRRSSLKKKTTFTKDFLSNIRRNFIRR